MLVGPPAGPPPPARAQLRTLFNVAAGCRIGFLILVTIGAWLGAALSVAIAVGIFYAFYGPVNMYVGIRGIGGTWRDIWRVYSVGLVPGAISVGSAYLIGRMISHNWLRLIVTVVVAFMLYLPLLRILSPMVWDEVFTRLRALIPRRAS